MRQLTYLVLKIPSWPYLSKITFWFSEQSARCWVSTSGFFGFWRAFVFIECIWELPATTLGYYESGAFLLIDMLYLFIGYMSTWHVSNCCSIYIMNHPL